MASTTMKSTALRMLQFALAVVIIGLAAHLIDTRISYFKFPHLALWHLLIGVAAALAALFGLLPIVTRSPGLSVVSSVLDVLVVIALFITAIMLSAQVEPGCKRDILEEDRDTHLWWPNRSCKWSPLFRALQAFLWTLPFLFLASIFMNRWLGKKRYTDDVDERRPDPAVDQPRFKNAPVLEATV